MSYDNTKPLKTFCGLRLHWRPKSAAVRAFAGIIVLTFVCSVFGLSAQQGSQTPASHGQSSAAQSFEAEQNQQSTPASQTPGSQSSQDSSGQTPKLQRAPDSSIPQASGKVSVETQMVTLYASVRDKHGKIVPTLNKEDFTLNEDGHPQAISYFVRESDLPLTLGLLVDTSMSQAKVLENERDASFTFLDHMMRQDKDAAFLIHFDHEVELLQDVTGSKPKLQAALKLLTIPQPDSDDDQNSGGGRGSHGSGTHLYDAVYLASHELMTKLKNRKAIFVLSDGADHGSKESLEESIEAAQRANTAIYALYFSGGEPSHGPGGFGGHGGMGRGGGYPGGGGGYPGGGHGGHYPQQEQRVDGKKVLQKMASETGGQFFEISKKLPIDQAYAEAEEELRNQYSLGYMPNPPDTEDGYHRIQLTVSQKDDSVQARDGYYSGQ
jgi:VWFA-related protein